MGIDAQLLIIRRDTSLAAGEVARLAERAVAELGENRFLADLKVLGFGPGALFTCPSVHQYLEHMKALGLHPERDASELTHADPAAPVWVQDGQMIVGVPGEQFLGSFLAELYFDGAYHRGDWDRIESVVEWVRGHIPGCEIWYGGDSGGAMFALLTKERQDTLRLQYQNMLYEEQ